MSTDKFPIPTPIGRGGGKELIEAIKGKGDLVKVQNLIGKSRYSSADGIDALILLTIAEDDPGTRDLIDTYSSILIAQDGLGRVEHIMLNTGIVAEKPLPFGINDQQHREPEQENRLKKFIGGNGHKKDQEDLEKVQ